MVFQKKVCLGSCLDPGGGGLPNPTESTMWGKGSSGARLVQNANPKRGAACELLVAYGRRRCHIRAAKPSIGSVFF